MKYNIEEILQECGYQVFYEHTNVGDVVNFPFIIYYVAYSNNVMADNIVYKKKNYYQVILHTAEKDSIAEENIEFVFEKNDIAWEVYESWNSDLMLFTRTYSFELL